MFHTFQYLYHYFIVLFSKPKLYKQKSKVKDTSDFIPYNNSTRKKPLWVKNKVIYLKVLLPDYGCRKIAYIFNKQYHNKNISISKSYVYYVIKENQYEILQQRNKLKNKVPRTLPNNFQWQIDLTNISDIYKNRNNILGIMDSGSRAILFLERLKDKSTITILKAIIFSIESYGKPKIIKSDNEIVFTSKFFRFIIWTLGIKHQKTQLASPWQNGKIERFFRTLKTTTNKLDFYSIKGIDKALKIFRFYYNFIRPHGHLNYFTPAEIWSNRTDFRYKDIFYFNELDDTIHGFYFVPK